MNTMSGSEPSLASNNVQCASLVSTKASLDVLHRILRNVKGALLFQSTGPTLHDSGTGVLVKDTVRLQTVMGMLAHKDLGLSELHVRFGKCHGHGLVLHTANLL